MANMLEMLPLRRAGKERRQLRQLRPEQIQPNPNQPRRQFDSQALAELTDSIRQYGLINPLTVRPAGEGYQLIAGERRWRACQAAGLQQIPCYVIDSTDQQSSLLALVENLQRQDLDFYEQALGVERLIRVYGMTQQQAAQSLGKTQSAVANKLRLLRLPEPVIGLLRQNQLTERHARALLKLETPEQQLQAAQAMVKHGLTVAQSEQYIQRMLTQKSKPPPPRPRKLQDVRLFMNTLNRAMDTMRQAGVGAAMNHCYQDGEMIVTIRIPAAPPKGQPGGSK